jgi:hypothetical protein
MQKIIVYLSIISFVFAFSFSCKKEIRSSIPESEVYIETSPSEYAKLRNSNSSVSYIPISGATVPINFKYGYGGVLIYRDLESKIRSCDLACPVEKSRTTRVEVSMPFALCPVCQSKYDLSYGFAAPVSGPAKESLHIYSNVYERTSPSRIVVSN